MTRWKRTVNIKGHLRSEQTADVIALRVRDTIVGAFGSPDPELASIIEDFESVGTDEECDEVLERLYDWADANRVWLGL
jgi:hypothetical protein